VLGKKQRTDNGAWLETLKNIESLVSLKEVEKLTTETVKAIKKTVKGKKSAYAWSGGKDSIVLGHVCESAGIHESMIGVCDLEYPAFIQWIQENKPKSCEVINVGLNLEWLAKNPKMLFPQNSAVAAKWFSIVQHRAQQLYYKSKGLDFLLLGRRRADGNYVGRKSNIYMAGNGVTRYSPLSEWSHEQVLAYCHYHKLPMPPIYDWHSGYVCGTHPWPARQYTKNEDNGWKEVFEIDPDIVREAATVLPGAKRYIEVVGA